jgi:hypothetical protein
VWAPPPRPSDFFEVDMAKKKKKVSFPQQADGILSLKHIDVGNQIAHVSASIKLDLPLETYLKIKRCPTVQIVIAEIGETLKC